MKQARPSSPPFPLRVPRRPGPPVALPDAAGAARSPSWLRRAAAPAAVGLAGVAALLLQPLPPELVAQIPGADAWPPLALRALLALNPALLVLVAALLGALLAHRVALRSVVAGTAAPGALLRVLGGSAVAGGALGLALAAVDAWLLPWLGPAWQRLAAAPAPASALAMGLLYGGLAEEVMLRWGLMSLLAWGLLRLLGGRFGGCAMPLAIVVAAAAFGAAHLPALAAQLELTPGVVARTLLLNGVAGLLYGGLAWRVHLEAAMAAHAATHLGLWAGRALLA